MTTARRDVRLSDAKIDIDTLRATATRSGGFSVILEASRGIVDSHLERICSYGHRTSTHRRSTFRGWYHPARAIHHLDRIARQESTNATQANHRQGQGDRTDDTVEHFRI